MEAQCVHNPAEQIARAELEACTARMMFQIGFSHASESSVDILSDLTRRYIQKMCATLRWVSEHCGRTEVSVGDVEYAYRKMNINVDEINEYMKQVRNYVPIHVLPRLKSDIYLKPYNSRRDLPSPNRHPEFPKWLPSTCTSYNTAQPVVPIENQCVPQNPRIPVLPDFTQESAVSLGLCKLKRLTEQNRSNVFQKFSPQPVLQKRPTSSCSLSFNSSSRPQSRISLGDTSGLQQHEKSRSPDIEIPVVAAPSVPMFKRRLVKRRSDDTPTPPPTTPCPSIIGKMRSDHSSVLDILQNASSRPSSPVVPALPISNPPVLAQIQAAVSRPSSQTNNQTGNIVTIASDLVRDPGGVLSAALAGRSAPSLPLPVTPIPRNSLNLYDTPEDDEQPTRIVQMAILRHLFTLDSKLPDQVAQAFSQIAGHREKSPISDTQSKPVYHIVKNEPLKSDEPVRILPPLKIRISRGFGDERKSIEPSPASALSHSPTDSDDSDDVLERKRRHKKKKKKKKKHKKMDEVDLDSSQPSPCEIKDEGGAIRLKIRLRPPSRPSSNAS